MQALVIFPKQNTKFNYSIILKILELHKLLANKYAIMQEKKN